MKKLFVVIVLAAMTFIGGCKRAADEQGKGAPQNTPYDHVYLSGKYDGFLEGVAFAKAEETKASPVAKAAVNALTKKTLRARHIRHPRKLQVGFSSKLANGHEFKLEPGSTIWKVAQRDLQSAADNEARRAAIRALPVVTDHYKPSYLKTIGSQTEAVWRHNVLVNRFVWLILGAIALFAGFIVRQRWNYEREFNRVRKDAARNRAESDAKAAEQPATAPKPEPAPARNGADTTNNAARPQAPPQQPTTGPESAPSTTRSARASRSPGSQGPGPRTPGSARAARAARATSEPGPSRPDFATSASDQRGDKSRS